MHSRVAIFVLLAVGLVFALLFGRQAYLARDLPRTRFLDKKLRVLTYSTFISSSGPGQEIMRHFKTQKGCEVEVQTVADAGLLLQRLKLANGAFDVVIGVDQGQLNQALQMQWQKLQINHGPWNVGVSVDPTDSLLPFDWSPLTFVYRSDNGIDPPQNLEELTASRFKNQLALEDPHTSSPGLQFVNWIRAVKGPESADFLKRLRPNVESVTPSWALAYGLFKKKQVGLVFSYLTSLAFHWGVEHDRNYRVAAFAEGHPVQTEFVGVPEGCTECQLAKELVTSLFEPWAQSLIMQKNFMLPVIPGIERDSIFAELPRLKTLAATSAAGQDLNDWDQVFRH